MKKSLLTFAFVLVAFPALASVSNPSRYVSASIGTTAAAVLQQGTTRVFLDIVNESSTATVACAFGSTPTINGAGSITLPPLWHRSWENNFIPTDAIYCVSSASSTPVTIGYQ